MSRRGGAQPSVGVVTIALPLYPRLHTMNDRMVPYITMQARRLYSQAQVFIAPCYTQPSAHLLSALLVLIALSRSMGVQPQQATLHASLALRMAEVTEALADIIH